ncbi:neuropeptide receptor 15-like [Babylonia areolata]|uniref:neuropeptide receptor 15-like n=1 Tax=Babylonia areolata TaxID=304850 RepID=UPI003FD2ADC6
MAQSRQPVPVTLEVVVVALAPHLSFNATNTSTTPFTLTDLSNAGPDVVGGGGSGGVGDSSSNGLGLGGGVGGIGVGGGGSSNSNNLFSEDGSGAGVGGAGGGGEGGMVSVSYIALFSTLFCLVGLVGLTGNVLVVYIVLKDRKMRKSVTNLLILNLAVADSLLMVLGVPEIVQFMLDRGWLLGLTACRVNRSVLVAALYASVLTLVAVCIERYIAIVYPMKAHLVCTRRRVVFVIVCVWILAISCCMPTALFNDVINPSEFMPHAMCITRFSFDTHFLYHIIFKFTEFCLFYFGPLVLQMVCYIIIGRRLFVGVDKLHRNSNIRSTPDRRQRTSEAIKARKGVVKMLIASVIIYFLSYSPHQVLLFFNTFSSMSFGDSWMYLVLTTTLAYINSAANPLLYCVFSENFRSKFKDILQCCTCEAGCRFRKPHLTQRSASLTSLTEYTTLFHKTSTSGSKKIANPASL